MSRLTEEQVGAQLFLDVTDTPRNGRWFGPQLQCRPPKIRLFRRNDEVAQAVEVHLNVTFQDKKAIQNRIHAKASRPLRMATMRSTVPMTKTRHSAS